MIPVAVEDMPRGSEFNLGRAGVVRVHRDANTDRLYAACENEVQVHALKRVLGTPGPDIQIDEAREEQPGLTTHNKTVAEVKVMVRDVRHRTHLVQLQETEMNNPKFPGGRPKVFHLIRERLEQVRDQ